MSDDVEFDKALYEVICEMAVYLSDELREMLNKSRVWVKDWVGRRDILGASRTPFRELAGDDPLECKIHMRMSVEKFNELLRLVEPHTSKADTMMRKVVPARVKLEITL